MPTYISRHTGSEIDEAVDKVGAIDTSVEEHVADETKHIGAETKTAPADADSVALIDSADGGKVKRLSWANLKALLGSSASIAWSAITGKPSSFTPSSHRSTGTGYGKGDSSYYGHLKLSSSYTSTSGTTSGYAATPSAVRTAYNKAVSAYNKAVEAYNKANGGAKIATGSYIGTGSYGDDSPTVFNFPFKPKLFIMSYSSEDADSYSYEPRYGVVIDYDELKQFFSDEGSSGRVFIDSDLDFNIENISDTQLSIYRKGGSYSGKEQWNKRDYRYRWKIIS